MSSSTSDGIKARDVSAPQGVDAWIRAKNEGCNRAIIRIHQEREGGRIDPNFIKSYNEVRAAGIDDIQAYIFPCTGSKNNCNSPETQIKNVDDYIRSNNLNVNRVWLDLEPSPGRNNWDGSKQQNADLAQGFMTSMKETGLKSGIYANPKQWSAMFPSRDTDIASEVPLWYAHWDGLGELSSGAKLMGGWNEPFGKQYETAPGFDMNIFRE